jgi:hypothetical protein
MRCETISQCYRASLAGGSIPLNAVGQDEGAQLLDGRPLGEYVPIVRQETHSFTSLQVAASQKVAPP